MVQRGMGGLGLVWVGGSPAAGCPPAGARPVPAKGGCGCSTCRAESRGQQTEPPPRACLRTAGRGGGSGRLRPVCLAIRSRSTCGQGRRPCRAGGRGSLPLLEALQPMPRRPAQPFPRPACTSRHCRQSKLGSRSTCRGPRCRAGNSRQTLQAGGGVKGARAGAKLNCRRCRRREIPGAWEAGLRLPARGTGAARGRAAHAAGRRCRPPPER